MSFSDLITAFRNNSVNFNFLSPDANIFYAVIYRGILDFFTPFHRPWAWQAMLVGMVIGGLMVFLPHWMVPDRYRQRWRYYLGTSALNGTLDDLRDFDKNKSSLFHLYILPQTDQMKMQVQNIMIQCQQLQYYAVVYDITNADVGISFFDTGSMRSIWKNTTTLVNKSNTRLHMIMLKYNTKVKFWDNYTKFQSYLSEKDEIAIADLEDFQSVLKVLEYVDNAETNLPLSELPEHIKIRVRVQQYGYHPVRKFDPIFGKRGEKYDYARHYQLEYQQKLIPLKFYCNTDGLRYHEDFTNLINCLTDLQIHNILWAERNVSHFRQAFSDLISNVKPFTLRINHLNVGNAEEYESYNPVFHRLIVIYATDSQSILTEISPELRTILQRKPHQHRSMMATKLVVIIKATENDGKNQLKNTPLGKLMDTVFCNKSTNLNTSDIPRLVVHHMTCAEEKLVNPSFDLFN